MKKQLIYIGKYIEAMFDIIYLKDTSAVVVTKKHPQIDTMQSQGYLSTKEVDLSPRQTVSQAALAAGTTSTRPKDYKPDMQSRELGHSISKVIL